jgi:hypothetical protein
MKTDTANHLPRSQKIPAVTLWVMLICGGITAVAYIFLQRPFYLVLPIELPSSYLSHRDWLSTTYSTYESPDSQDRYYIWRKETYIRMRNSDPQSPFDSTQSVFEYFGVRLEKEGWEFYEIGYGDPCVLYLPEARFLPTGIDGYVAYRKPDVNSYSTSPTVCLAVYSFSEDVVDTYYYVVLVTVNPSTLTVWNNQFELGWK